MLLDFSHLNERSFFEVAKIWKKPILVSHANVRALSSYGQDRNLSDNQIQIIGESKGLIGITFSRNMIRQNRRVTLDDLINHIVYIRDLVGIERIAIGSDFGGLLHGSPAIGMRRLKDIGNLWEAMSRRGLSRDEIDSIAWKNAHEFLIENL
jgi:membrane dipeptidase